MLRREMKASRKRFILKLRWILGGMITGMLLMYAVMRAAYEIPMVLLE